MTIELLFFLCFTTTCPCRVICHSCHTFISSPDNDQEFSDSSSQINKLVSLQTINFGPCLAERHDPRRQTKLGSHIRAVYVCSAVQNMSGKKVQDLHHLRSAALLRSHSLSDSHISGNSKFRLLWTGSMAYSCWTKGFSDLTLLCPTIFPCLKGTNICTIIFCLLELHLVLVCCTDLQPPFQIIDSAQNPKWLKRDQTKHLQEPTRKSGWPVSIWSEEFFNLDDWKHLPTWVLVSR